MWFAESLQKAQKRQVRMEQATFDASCEITIASKTTRTPRCETATCASLQNAQVKAVQSSVKGAFRQLPKAWQAVKGSKEATQHAQHSAMLKVVDQSC